MSDFKNFMLTVIPELLDRIAAAKRPGQSKHSYIVEAIEEKLRKDEKE